ncbi:MAG: FxsB family radical SAM/SPASM domain protein [Frankia sp.]|nr:FxsB family radical SAM/SPASM domain protein [Frankia sp.]
MSSAAPATWPLVSGAGVPVRPPEWPRDLLDVAGLASGGWRPRPFRQFIVKIHSRCNLACSYCYVYASDGAGWREQPRVMSRDTARRVADRIAEHAGAHDLPTVDVVLHGGEPLLAGAAFISWFAGTLRAAVRPGTRLRLSAQTNGLLLTPAMLDALAEHDIRVGVSLDGPREVNDRRRPRADGRGSHADAARGLRLLGSPRYRRLFAGVLAVVDLSADPLDVYAELLKYDPPAIDVLLPHGTWSTPPPGRPTDDPATTPYADWLVRLFDRWYDSPRQETDIRLFSTLISLLLGGRGAVESVGLAPATLLVIETDGSLEQVDTLRAAYDGAADTGLDVFRHPFDEALRQPGVAARQLGMAALAPACQACPVGRVCGGGYYPHRYRAGAGYRNPSVYCPDLLALITHIERRVRVDLVDTLSRLRHATG